MKTPKYLEDTFGLRFVQTNIEYSDSETYDMCYLAYDAFKDLAYLLKIPCKMIGLNGSLAVSLSSSTMPSTHTTAFYTTNGKMLAFRDKHKFTAIAHEWFHAIDHYLSYTYTAKGKQLYSKSRGEWKGDASLKEAYNAVWDCVYDSDYYKSCKSIAKKLNKDYWADSCEVLARAFEAYIAKKMIDKGFVNIHLVDTHEVFDTPLPRPYPDFSKSKDTPIITAFDNFFEKLNDELKKQNKKLKTMKLTIDNLLTEYPKVRDKMSKQVDSEWDSEKFAKFVKLYGKSDTIKSMVDVFIEKANDCLKDDDEEKAPAKDNDGKTLSDYKFASAFMVTAQKPIVRGAWDEYKKTIADLDKQLSQMPKLRGQESLGNKAIVYAHYFGCGTDIFITERSGDYLFGYTILANDCEMSEWGESSLDEITSVDVMQLDFHWQPKTMEQALYDCHSDYFPNPNKDKEDEKKTTPKPKFSVGDLIFMVRAYDKSKNYALITGIRDGSYEIHKSDEYGTDLSNGDSKLQVVVKFDDIALKNYKVVQPKAKKEPKAKKAKAPKAKFKIGEKVVTDHNSEVVCVVKEKNLDKNNYWHYILDGASGLWAEEQLQKAPKKSEKATKEDTATKVKQISAEVLLFKSYANLNGKNATYRQLLSLHTKLGNAIVSGAVDSPKYQELLKYMHEQLGKAMKLCGQNGSLSINVENVDKYREIGASEKLFVGVTLIKRYINLANKIGMNKEDREKQRQNLLSAVNKALDNKKVENQYIDYVKAIKKNLADKSIAPISLDLSGLAGIYGLAGEIADEILNGCDGGRCNGLGSIVSATELAKLDFDTIRIPQEYRRMIGNASKNGSIMLYGMAGGGKTSFSINLAKKCAEMGQKVLIVSKEEGINQTMQEKLKRFNAVNPNIFVTENVPANTKDYDVIIFDSVQSLQLEPADLEKHQHNLNALRVYVFQVTKDGKFRGANEFEHLVDCVLRAEKGTITSTGCKNRFGGNGSVKVF